MFVSKIEIFDHILDNDVPAVTLFIHDIVLVRLDFTAKPGNFAILGQLVIIKPGAEPTGDTQVIIAGSCIHCTLL